MNRSQNFQDNKPLLYLLATPIGNLGDISPRFKETLDLVSAIGCEDTRNTLKLLNVLGLSKPLFSLHEHNEVTSSLKLIEKLESGESIAYVSDAGYPCISDPGSKLVKMVIEKGFNVTVIPGPSAFISALVASGLPCDHFYFHGFLDAKENVKKEELRNLYKKTETLIFYESPHRIKKTLLDLKEILGSRKACIARELTKKHEEYIRGNLEEFVDIEEDTLKGEMVIIVEGNNEEIAPILDEDIVKTVTSLTELGMSTKDAIKKASEILNISKNYIYDLVHKN